MKKAIVSFIIILFLPAVSWTEHLHFTIAQQPDGSHHYYMELIEKALANAGHSADFTLLKNIPDSRVELMLDSGDITLNWFVQNPVRDRRWIPLPVGLTNGLIGQRVFLIPEGSQKVFDGIDSLDSFREAGFTGAFGNGWYDGDVWKANDLPFIPVDGDWRKIFLMLEKGNRGIDYFSRGINEIHEESELHPGLDIEKNLLFIYKRDFIFYLSKHSNHYADILNSALRKAETAGIISGLADKYWEEDLTSLGIKDRKKIYLSLPD